jgi:hypothetical protein
MNQSFIIIRGPCQHRTVKHDCSSTTTTTFPSHHACLSFAWPRLVSDHRVPVSWFCTTCSSSSSAAPAWPIATERDEVDLRSPGAPHYDARGGA